MTLKELEGSDWECAFEYAGEKRPDWSHGYDVPYLACSPDDPRSKEPQPGFARADVERIIALAEGENDGPRWVGVFKLKDGRFACLSAGCDYTGWDCQAGGNAHVAPRLKDIIRWGLTADERDRLHQKLPEDTKP